MPRSLRASMRAEPSPATHRLAAIRARAQRVVRAFAQSAWSRRPGSLRQRRSMQPASACWARPSQRSLGPSKRVCSSTGSVSRAAARAATTGVSAPRSAATAGDGTDAACAVVPAAWRASSGSGRAGASTGTGSDAGRRVIDVAMPGRPPTAAGVGAGASATGAGVGAGAGVGTGAGGGSAGAGTAGGDASFFPISQLDTATWRDAPAAPDRATVHTRNPAHPPSNPPCG